MNGKELVELIEQKLAERHMSKKEFYAAVGITSAAFSNWRTGANFPSYESLRKIEDVLGISFGLVDNQSNYHQREEMRQEMRILFDAAEGVPTSAILEAAALLMRYKEKNQ